MNRLGRNVSLVIRTEGMILRRQASVASQRAILLALAGLVALLALVFLNVAAFLWLKTLMPPEAAAFSLAMGDLVIAGLLVAIAARKTPGAELEPVIELRNMALAELQEDAAMAATEAREVSDNLRRIARDPFGSGFSALLGPLLSILLKTLKK